MKKVILLFVTAFMALSCFNNGSDSRTVEDELYSTAREVLKQSMKDPSSYEKVSFREDYSNVGETKSFILSYRGKNGFGGLVLSEVRVIATNDENLAFIGLEAIK